MGLKDILTKPINIGSTVYQWNEPMLYRLRLRGDLWLRALIVLGAWAGATGLMLGVFAFNANPPGLLTAIGLGTVIGLGPATILTMMLRDHVGGSVKVRRNDISTYKQYASLAVFRAGWMEVGEWPYSTVGKCVIVPGHRIHKPFGVMLLTIGSGTMILGIPQKIDLKKLAEFLAGKGVNVTAGQSVPATFRKPLSLFAGLAVPALAVPLFLAGSACYLVKVGLPGRDRGNQLAQRDDFPAMRETVPPPPDLRHPPTGFPSVDSSSSEAPSATAETPSGFGGSTSTTTEPDLKSGFGGGRMTPDAGDEPASTVDAPPAVENPFVPVRSEPDQPAESSDNPFVPKPADNPFVPKASDNPFVPKPQEPSTAGNTESPGRDGRTAAVGGTGGAPFETIDRQGRPVIGVRARMGSWGGVARVGKLEPLFESATARGRETVQLAREGYALGALDVSGKVYVDAVRPVFMKVTAIGRLDTDDSYEGDWIGTPAEDAVTRLTGGGERVVGFFGRGLAVVDAVGLVVEGK